MRKAYDTILQSEVSAELAAQNGGSEPYRYECACCGEEVYVAAPYSTKVAAHFRHRCGNNDVECENYLGQYGSMSTDSCSRKNNRERADFFYDNSNKTFSLGLRFTDSEIQTYEKQSVDFEVRTKELDKPFYVLEINRTYFSPDVPTLIPLLRFSYSYYLSNTLNGVKRKYEFLKHDAPTFFKMQGNEGDFKAKLVRGDTLFTDTRYFVAFQGQYSLSQLRLPADIQVLNKFYFETMGRKFLGIVLSIPKKATCIENLLLTWGYRLEASEMLTLLWPPTPVVEEVFVTSSNYVFLYSSFELQAHGNINVHPKDIFKIANGISKVFVKQKTKVFRKNVEIAIENRDSHSTYFDTIDISVKTSKIYTVPEENTYFLIGRYGIKLLHGGQTIYLTPQNEIRHYCNSYLTDRIVPCKQKKITGESLLINILAHYRRTEAFDKNYFSSSALSKTAHKYIQKCEASGLINSVAKQYILEGRL